MQSVKTNINIRAYLSLLLKRAWIMVLAFVLSVVTVYLLYEMPKQPIYTAQATMMVKSSDADQRYYTSAESYAAQALIKTCSVAIKSDTVASQIKEKLANDYPNLTIGQIKACMTAASVNETEIMSITASTASPELSVAICNAALEVVPQMLLDVVKVGAANVLDGANSASPSNFPSMRTPIMAGILAALLVAGVLFLIFILDTRIKGSDEIVRLYKLPVIGEIPNFNVTSGKRYSHYSRYSKYSSYETKEEK